MSDIEIFRQGLPFFLTALEGTARSSSQFAQIEVLNLLESVLAMLNELEVAATLKAICLCLCYQYFLACLVSFRVIRCFSVCWRGVHLEHDMLRRNHVPG